MTRKFDCKGDGCGECQVCRYLDYLDWVESVAFDGPKSIERSPKIDAYLAEMDVT
ncbi:hypothetical protein LCGC14_0231400 [marine sediment metagenome]|uniref:Uncharacterized protein n=1 Tax=marine sediment metagenome TaxID=412755 RepID=A0A0F9XE33_9ZZZZ